MVAGPINLRHMASGTGFGPSNTADMRSHQGVLADILARSCGQRLLTTCDSGACGFAFYAVKYIIEYSQLFKVQVV